LRNHPNQQLKLGLLRSSDAKLQLCSKQPVASKRLLTRHLQNLCRDYESCWRYTRWSFYILPWKIEITFPFGRAYQSRRHGGLLGA